MPALTIQYRDDAERLALEQAIAYVAQLRQVAQDAPDGTVLATCEQLALHDGRALLRSTLRDRMKSSPLMDAPDFSRALESAFRHMWQRSIDAR